MKYFIPRALLVLATLTLASLGCQQTGDETFADDLSEEDVSEAEEQLISPTPICSDMEIVELKTVFCGFQTGPYDTSPIDVTCTRTCYLDRKLVFTLDGAQCTTVSTTCDGWDCPSCD